MRILDMKQSIILMLLTAAVASLFAVACGSDAPASTPAPTPNPPPMTEEASDADWEAILGTTVLRPGSQRVAFLLVGPKALITVPEVSVSTFFVSDAGSADGPKETKSATFNQWPYGTRGSYTTDLSFDRPGHWRLEIEGDEGGGTMSRAILQVEVTDGFSVVDIGSKAPASMNRTIENAAGLEELTSAHDPDPDLYTTTIANALDQGRPTMVVFSTPAFCTSATCGPQVETVSEVQGQYGDRASFIHVEVYDNPHEVQGDLDRAITSPIMDEWGLTSVPDWANESWVFVMDRNGQVTARFEAYSTATELEEALLQALN